MSAGKLILVPTPIGNLEDITLRAIRVLGEVDAVIAEDTRVSGRLLQHLGISKPFIPFHAHNEHHVLENIIARL
ncbi:MAG: 16S rRNA (cytidine(1402)-2'-O)-methyltransferase, partial [Flavobacteriales bacterium]|nr:16S rRNA (cytidine(1402)-2'-O)-methyltransferase [Flavobacteriales bacterium]